MEENNGKEKKKRNLLNKSIKLFTSKTSKLKVPDNFSLSEPANFRQTAHVGFDPETGEFEGMPKEWEVLLLTSGLKKDDYSENPQMLLKVLEYQQEYLSTNQTPSSPPPQHPPPVPRPHTVILPPEEERPSPPPMEERRTSSPLGESSYSSIIEEQRKKKLPPLPPPKRSDTISSFSLPSPKPNNNNNANENDDNFYKETLNNYNNIIPNNNSNQEKEKEREKPPVPRRASFGSNSTSMVYIREKPPLPAKPITSPPVSPREKTPIVPLKNTPPPPIPRKPITLSPSTPPEQTPEQIQHIQQQRLQLQQQQQLLQQQRDQERKEQEEQEMREQQAREQQLREQQEQEMREQERKEQERKDQQEQESREQPTKEEENTVATESVTPRSRGKVSLPSEIYRILEPLISKEDPTTIYIEQSTIGQGSSGTVTVAIDRRTNEKVAIKKMVLSHGVNQIDTLESEISIMKASKHKNIVNYVDSYIVGNTLWCVMEYMDGGDLTEVIRICRKRYKESQIAAILREVLEGLKYLHNLPSPIVHRDIKSDNVLLGLDGRVKLTDFGFGAQLTKEKNKRNSIIGTTYWMAPEVITSRDYDTKIDVWSVGILAQEIVEGEPPYMEESAVKALYLIASQGRAPFKDPNRLSPAFKNFVKQCTIMDPSKRPTSTQLLKHPFIATACPLEGLTPIVKATQEALAAEWEEF